MVSLILLISFLVFLRLSAIIAVSATAMVVNIVIIREQCIATVALSAIVAAMVVLITTIKYLLSSSAYSS